MPSIEDTIKQAVTNGLLSQQSANNIIKWYFEPEYLEYRNELESQINDHNWQELDDAFYSQIRVGTGGIRGPIGIGPNRINRRTIGEAAQALSNFIIEFGQEYINGGVVIGHEVRKQSKQFQRICCEVFAANGIKTYIFDDFRSTPELSFAVRYIGTTAGVQLTASHNPRTDNGFKFYWSDGGQVVPPLDEKFMQLVTSVTEVKRLSYEEAIKSSFIKIVDQAVDEAYYEAVLRQSVSGYRSAKVTFSPMHGAGSTNVLPVLKRAGYNIEVVPEQLEADENFPTAYGEVINPEFDEVMELPIKLASQNDSDIAITSDPDADRIRVAYRDNISGKDTINLLSGNEVGILLTKYLLSELKLSNKLKSENLIIETYVTSSLISKIASAYQVKIIDNLLVGFKYIGEIISGLANVDDFVFAAEESLGYFRGNYARDKDGACSALLIAELASKLKEEQKTLADYLDEIYAEHGYFNNSLMQLNLGEGVEGKNNIIKVMLGLRANPPKNLVNEPIISINDRLSEERRTPSKYVAGATGDQLSFILSNDNLNRLTIRPSGTEPIIKIYLQYWQEVGNKDLETVKKTVNEKSQQLINDMKLYCQQFIKS